MNDFLAILVFTLLLNGTVEAQVVISSNDNSPTEGAAVTLTCSITGFATNAFWFNSSNNAILNDCLPDGSCATSVSGRYSYTANASAIIVRITSFTSAQDDFVWKCQHSTFTTIFSFTKSGANKTGETGLSTAAIVGISIGAVVFVAVVVVVIICVIQKDKFCKSSDVKNKTGGTNNSGNRNQTQKLQETHAASKTPKNANTEAIKPFDQSERRPLPPGPLPSLHPRNVNQPLDGEHQNLEEPKKKKKKSKKKQKDEGTMEEGMAREG